MSIKHSLNAQNRNIREESTSPFDECNADTNSLGLGK